MKLVSILQQKIGYVQTRQWGYKYAKGLKPRPTRTIQFEPKDCHYKNEIFSCNQSKVSTKNAYVVISK